MNAIYARQSVDRADSISIQSQLEFCRYELRGEAYQEYIDKGFSGKNTERPQFQKMLLDIKEGLIEKVVVYKLDRISRSILDFSNMMELFEKYRVKFISSTEKFDTSTPMGRAMLNICIVFAQLERETIQKRVSDAYISRSQKSLYMGGRVPYGFRLEQTILHGIKTAKYILCPEEAAQIRLMYELYAAPQTSYGDIIRIFEARHIQKNGKPWQRSRLADYLRNPIYVQADYEVYAFFQKQGVTIVNDAADFIGANGCYLYANPDAKRSKTSSLTGCTLVLAPHEGIIPSVLWLQCRNKCLHNKQIQTGRKAVNTWLSGKIKCLNCGYALIKKQYANRDASYFFCSHRLSTHSCKGCGTIYGDALEQLIFEELREKLLAFPLLRCTQPPKYTPKTAALQAELAQVEHEIEALLCALKSANDVLRSYINEKIVELDSRRQLLSQTLAAVPAKAADRKPSLCPADYLEQWDTISLDTKRQITDCLIHVIHAGEGHIVIQWKF